MASPKRERPCDHDPDFKEIRQNLRECYIQLYPSNINMLKLQNHTCQTDPIPIIHMKIKETDNANTIKAKIETFTQQHVHSVTMGIDYVTVRQGSFFLIPFDLFFRLPNGQTYKNHSIFHIKNDGEMEDLIEQMRRLPLNGACEQIHFGVNVFSNGHVCAQGLCGATGSHRTNRSKMAYQLSVYICKDSASVHVCGRYCDSTLVNPNQMYVCQLTGEELEMPPLAPKMPELPSWDLYNPYAKNIPWKYRKTPHETFLSVSGSRQVSFFSILLSNFFLQVLQSSNPCSRRAQPRMDSSNDYYVHAYVAILSILSEKRFSDDIQSNKNKDETKQLKIRKVLIHSSRPMALTKLPSIGSDEKYSNTK